MMGTETPEALSGCRSDRLLSQMPRRALATRLVSDAALARSARKTKPLT